MESVFSADGTRIAYHRAGDGPPLILVHGIAQDHTYWRPVLPGLLGQFTVYSIDRRGRGGSGPTDDATYAIEREFEDVAAVVETVGEPAHLLGFSYGALCSLEAALRTGNLRKLILYEPSFPMPPGSPGSPPGMLERMEKQLEAGDREGVALTMFRDIVGLPDEVISAVRSSPAWQVVIAVAPTIIYEVRAVGDYRFDPERFHDMTTPTLLLTGSETSPFLRAATEAVADALPEAQLGILAGQGHVGITTAPDLFLHEVVQFLTEE